jgi:hypothetical protein
MKTLSVLGFALLLGCSREAQSAGRRTVVLELFTSQGCSSCPPADELLSRLRREDFGGATVIPLAYHVDYWNHLGWSDPFSSPRWSARQREYAAAIKSSQVYTPQLIVNGTVQLVGSSERHVRAEIDRQLKGSDRGTVSIDRITRNGKQLDVELHAKVDRGRANLVIVLFENDVVTHVPRGENARRTLTNDAIVRWQSAALEPGTVKVAIPLAESWRPEHLGVAAFLQDAASREIIASTKR